MKSPEAGRQGGPSSKVETNIGVENLKRSLKFAFWDFQAKNGAKATLGEFSRDPSFVRCLNDAKRGGLSVEDLIVAVDFIRDSYGRKLVAQQDNVRVSPPPEVLDPKSTEPSATASFDQRFLVTPPVVAAQRPSSPVRPEGSQIVSMENERRISEFAQVIERQFSDMARNVYVKRKEAQYMNAKGGPTFSPERYALYMNGVYNDARDYSPYGDDVHISIKDDSLVCKYKNTSELGKGNHTKSFDIKEFDEEARKKILTLVTSKWQSFVRLANEQRMRA